MLKFRFRSVADHGCGPKRCDAGHDTLVKILRRDDNLDFREIVRQIIALRGVIRQGDGAAIKQTPFVWPPGIFLSLGRVEVCGSPFGKLMSMPTDFEHGEFGCGRLNATDDGRTFPTGSGLQNPSTWMFGSRVAASNVEAARKAYFHYADLVEYALNVIESTTSRVGKDFWAAARVTRETLRYFRERSSASANEMHGRVCEQVERGSSAVDANVAKGRAGFRDIAWRGQIAADTNVRACFDCLDDLANASSVQSLVLAQTSFFWDQWRRSLNQTLDLQRRAVGTLRRTFALAV